MFGLDDQLVQLVRMERLCMSPHGRGVTTGLCSTLQARLGTALDFADNIFFGIFWAIAKHLPNDRNPLLRHDMK